MKKEKMIYVSPNVEIVNIELEQAVLQCSIENLGDVHDEMDWD